MEHKFKVGDRVFVRTLNLHSVITDAYECDCSECNGRYMYDLLGGYTFSGDELAMSVSGTLIECSRTRNNGTT